MYFRCHESILWMAIICSSHEKAVVIKNQLQNSDPSISPYYKSLQMSKYKPLPIRESMKIKTKTPARHRCSRMLSFPNGIFARWEICQGSFSRFPSSETIYRNSMHSLKQWPHAGISPAWRLGVGRPSHRFLLGPGGNRDLREKLFGVDAHSRQASPRDLSL